jgi:aminoglycoside 3-N-acetyltransferase
VGLAFTPAFWWLQRSGASTYSPSSPPLTGAFAKALLATPGAIRSNHPVESFVALGPRAQEIIDCHLHSASPFAPMNGLLQTDGKMLLVGCVSDSPGFSTVHLAQERMGLARRVLGRGMSGVWVEKNGRKTWFRRDEIPGCSRGFWKFYGHYVRAGSLSQANIGAAYSVGIDARRALAVEEHLMQDNPRFPLCDDPLCASCRLMKTYNKRDWPMFFVRSLTSGKLLKKFRTK